MKFKVRPENGVGIKAVGMGVGMGVRGKIRSYGSRQEPDYEGIIGHMGFWTFSLRGRGNHERF